MTQYNVWHSIMYDTVPIKYDSMKCTFGSKINVTPKNVYLPISKLHSIVAVANLVAHNNKSQIISLILLLSIIFYRIKYKEK